MLLTVLTQISDAINSDPELRRKFAFIQIDSSKPVLEGNEDHICALLSQLPLSFDINDVVQQLRCAASAPTANKTTSIAPSSDLATASNRLLRLMRPPGHVFCALASVCDIHCDAFLCPVAIGKAGSLNGKIWTQWKRQLSKTRPQLLSELLARGPRIRKSPRMERVTILSEWPWHLFLSEPSSAIPFIVLG